MIALGEGEGAARATYLPGFLTPFTPERAAHSASEKGQSRYTLIPQGTASPHLVAVSASLHL